MNKFHIEPQEDLPSVSIDFEAGLVELEGKLLPEDSVKFFDAIESAVKKYLANPKKTTTIKLKLEYMNSSSQKRLIEILSLFEILLKKGYGISAQWIYHEDDEDILEEGRDLAKMINLPFEFTSV